MSTQFESVRNSVQAIRAWGSLEKGFVQVCLSLDAGPSHRPKVELDVDDIADVMFDSDVWIGDIYYLSRDRWFSQFGIIKSLTGLSNKTIGGYIEHLDKAGQLFETEMSSSWEECIVDNGKIICPVEDEEPEEFIVEDTSEPEKWEPKDEEKFNEWMDNVIRIIGEVADASPEELERLGENIKHIGKELGEDWELMDEQWEDDEEEVIETPMKPDESPIANQIMEEVSSEKPEYTGHITWRSWGPKHGASFHGDDILTEQEIQQGRRSHRSFLDKILDEMVSCEPLGLEEIQERWEKTWRDMSKEWQRHALDRRHKEQEKRSRWDLFNGLTGKTPPWPMINPRDPEF
jgi:hypothetical protein